MKLVRVQRVLTKRLAWLTAKATSLPKRHPVAQERDALHTLLRCQAMLDVEQVARHAAACESRVLPAEQRTKARAKRGDELVGRVLEFVVRVQRAARAA
jgi:hypothetical protein